MLNSLLVFSLAFVLTLASWLTWGSSCADFQKAYWSIPEGAGSGSYSGMCAGDGIQFVGVFVMALVVSSIFVALAHLLLKLLGFQITRRKK